MEWLPLILPVVAITFCYYWFKSKILWWEPLVTTGIVAIFILVFKFTAEQVATTDKEYWTGYITHARYYEAWDEYIHQTCTETCCCDSDGNNCSTYTYDCSYVDHHSEYWKMYDNNGISYNISQSKYNSLVKQFGVSQVFHDMHRDYHSYDGDMYQINWKGNDSSLEYVVSEHSYENRIQASRSVFNFRDVSEKEKIEYGIYEYPEVIHNKQRHILGVNDNVLERKMQILNARLGKKKQVKSFILLYPGKSKESADLQEAYWKGGNKNEFIVCIGTDKAKKKITWMKTITWNLNKELDIRVRNQITSNKDLNLSSTIDFMYKNIHSTFKRQPFKEFSYLEVELTSNQLLAVWIVSALISILMSVWMIKNPFEDMYNRYY